MLVRLWGLGSMTSGLVYTNNNFSGFHATGFVPFIHCMFEHHRILKYIVICTIKCNVQYIQDYACTYKDHVWLDLDLFRENLPPICNMHIICHTVMSENQYIGLTRYIRLKRGPNTGNHAPTALQLQAMQRSGYKGTHSTKIIACDYFNLSCRRRYK